MANEKFDLRSLFLREFVKAILSNYKIPEIKVQYENLVHDSQNVETSQIPFTEDFSQSMIAREDFNNHVLSLIPKAPRFINQPKQIKPNQRQIIPIRHNLPRPVIHPIIQNIKMTPKTQVTGEKGLSIANLGLSKIDNLLRSPSILSIESPGPGRPLLINNSGAIQSTQVALTNEEIDKILKEFSEQTKIPLIPGMFKAVYRNLIITAVISEVAGTRFLIQKRNPFQRF
ncbi:hypothetical protein J4408_01105 [Candidatus Pacearchaeota archaeon]|nr:hypothetical protein [Candidatus Pacearchaeota archaeon]